MIFKSITVSNLLNLLVLVVMGINNVFAQDPKPDRSTTDALNSLINAPRSSEKYENSDRDLIQKNIQTAFLNWSQKGEYEKQADYEIRIQNQSQSKFTEICIEEIKKKINSFRYSDLNIDLLRYDAENELFPAVFTFKDREWKNQVIISIDKARNFKEVEWRNLFWQKEVSQWCFIHNDLFPSKIYLASNSYDITFKLPLPNQDEIKVAFNDLGIDNTYLRDFIFKYSTPMDKENIIYSPDGVANARKNYFTNDPNGDPNASAYYGTGKGLDGDGNYLLGGRRALNKEKYQQDCNESGVVVVSIEIDRSGKVIRAVPGVRGTTNNSRCLLEPAKRAALATRFNSDPEAPSEQIGKIIYRFRLSE